MTKKLSLANYKKEFRDLKIPHRVVAAYTGCTREHITVILNGRPVPYVKAKHLIDEFSELLLIGLRRNKEAKKVNTKKTAKTK